MSKKKIKKKAYLSVIPFRTKITNGVLFSRSGYNIKWFYQVLLTVELLDEIHEVRPKVSVEI